VSVLGVVGDRWRKVVFRNLAKNPMFLGARLFDGVPDGIASRKNIFDMKD
jgi:hypothetical protein